MLNKKGINEPLALDSLYSDTFNMTHGKQEQWNTRDYVQQGVWQEMINKTIDTLMKEPAFWTAVARHLKPTDSYLLCGPEWKPLPPDLVQPVDVQVTPEDTVLRDEIAQALAAQGALLQAIADRSRDMLPLLRRIAENTGGKVSVPQASHPGLLGSMR